MSYDTILFDFDGTVYDTVEGITKSARYALNRMGLDAELEELRCFAGPPLLGMFMEKFGFDWDTADRATKLFRERYNPIGLYESRVFPGVRELVERLRAAGKRVGIATSKPLRLAEELLEREGMRELFDAVSGSGDQGQNNSKAEVLAAALRMLGAEKESAVLVGDTKWDVFGANELGLPCIGVGYGYAAPGELEAAGAVALAPDLAELEKLLLA